MAARSALVTGAGGFIGSLLTERLAASGWRVFAHTRTLADKRQSVKERLKGAQVLEGSLEQALESSSLETGIDFVVHLAGSGNVQDSIANPIADLERNTITTLNVLEWAKSQVNKPRVIYVSSAAVYGNPETMPITESTALNPVSPYGVSKLAAENYARLYHQLHHVPTAIARPFSVYGPGQEKLVIHDLFKQLNAPGNELRVRGDGSQSRDFIHVGDLINALICIAQKSAFQADVYNVACGTSITIKQLASLILQASNANRAVVFSGAVGPGEPLNWSVNISRLRSLGFEPTVSLLEGLREIAPQYVGYPQTTVRV